MRFRDRRFLSLLLVALASVAALALSACGGGGDSGDAKALLNEAFKKPINSANVALDVSAKIDGSSNPQLGQPISLKLSGPYESRGKNKVPKLSWDINVAGGGQNLTGKLISTGDNAYVGFQGQNYEVGSQLVQQYEQTLGQQSQSATSLQQYGVDPNNWIKDAKMAGDEDVAGAATTKITGGLDVEKMLNDINTLVEKAGPAMGQSSTQKLTPEQVAQVKQVIKDPTFEAFVAKDDKTLRRLSATISFTIPEAGRSQAQGVTGGNVKFSIEFSNVGQPATVTAPADAKPLSELQSQLPGGLGGAGGSGSSGSNGGSGSGSGSSPSSDQFQKYAECLQQANSDATKVEACSALLK